jgi:hypothetical protein
MIKIDYENRRIIVLMNINQNTTLKELKSNINKLSNLDDYKIIIKQGIWKT